MNMILIEEIILFILQLACEAIEAVPQDFIFGPSISLISSLTKEFKNHLSGWQYTNYAKLRIFYFRYSSAIYHISLFLMRIIITIIIIIIIIITISKVVIILNGMMICVNSIKNKEI